MLRRIYFSFLSAEKTRRVVTELETAGVKRNRIHTIARSSEYAASTKDIVEPYGLYKRSLSLTSKKKNQEKAIVVVQKFINSWGMLANKYTNDVPDQLNQTVDFNSKINRPVTVGEEALAMLKAGGIKKAH